MAVHCCLVASDSLRSIVQSTLGVNQPKKLALLLLCIKLRIHKSTVTKKGGGKILKTIEFLEAGLRSKILATEMDNICKACKIRVFNDDQIKVPWSQRTGYWVTASLDGHEVQFSISRHII